MQRVQPLLRLAVLLAACWQGRAAAVDADPDSDSDPDRGPSLAPRYDFSRYFGSGGDPGGGLGLGSGKATAAASEQDDDAAGFVEPVDFKSFFGGAGGGGAGFGGKQHSSPFFGASVQKGSRLPFGSSSFGALSAASSAEDDFADFNKAKRGAAGASGQTRDAADDDFFRFDFPEGGGKADLEEDADDRDEADDEDRPSRPLKAANVRYPSYSSYYNTHPEQLRAAGGRAGEAQDADDDFGFEDDEAEGAGLAAEEVRQPKSSAEAYDSRPFKDTPAVGGLGGLGAGTKASSPGPSRFSLQGGFVPSPVDPLRTQASQSSQASRAASHAAVHAAVKAAHRAASAHGKSGAGAAPGTVLGLTDTAGLGPTARSFYVRRAREEPDDAFFESYTDGDKEGEDYRFGPEHFDEDEDAAAEKATEDDDGDGEAAAGQSAAATAGNCKKVSKKGSVCMVCTDPKTGGNYEQCQYATEPETQSYSFGRSSSYGNPRPKNRRRRRREEGRRALQERQDSQQDSSTQQDAQEAQEAQGQRQQDTDVFGDALKDSHEKDNEQIQDELESSLEQLQGPKYEDYFSFLFPELAKEKTEDGKKSGKQEKGKKKGRKKKKSGKKKKVDDSDSEEVSGLLSRLEDDDDPFAAETTSGAAAGGPGPGSEDIWLGPPESVGPPGMSKDVVVPKKDLERMLGEFQQKDRSDCTKVEKDKMTCYQCVDKKGMQHEECMFVAASEPKQSHLAYHQSSAFKQPGPPPSAKTASATTTTVAPPRQDKGKASQHAAASNAAPSTAAAPKKGAAGGAKSRQQRAAEQAKEEHDDDDDKEELQEADEDADEEPEGPQGLGQAPDDGMFTEETRPVYDRALRMSLPKYMLDMSEHERVFDEVLASGM